MLLVSGFPTHFWFIMKINKKYRKNIVKNMIVFINLSKNKNYKTKNMVFFSFFKIINTLHTRF
jgi:hypothetical protein